MMNYSREKTMAEVEVIIVGGGPAGIATSACLNRAKVSNVVLEREDCSASLWKKRSYDRLKLHLAKQFCQLPNMPFPTEAPLYVPRNDFICYLDDYVKKFDVKPRYHCSVESAFYDKNISKWSILVKNLLSGAYEVYFSTFLVAATGENSEGYIPQVPGIEGFEGKVLHSSQYDNGKSLSGKNVLVVGCGNSGMEIAYDLSNSNVNTSIVVRSPVHILTADIVKIGMLLLRFFPMRFVDTVMVTLGRLRFGNLAKYGFQTPKDGPFFFKMTASRSPTIDVGAVDQIKSGQIKVFPSVIRIEGNNVAFDNGKMHQFDAIIFATGYKSTVKNWLKGEDDLFNEKGMPRQRLPNLYWKGQNGLYCAGFSSRGLLGISEDAQNIAQDISYNLIHKGKF